MSFQRPIYRALALGAAGLLLAAACADDEQDAAPAPAVIATTAAGEQPTPVGTVAAAETPTPVGTVAAAETPTPVGTVAAGEQPTPVGAPSATEAPAPVAEAAPVLFDGFAAGSLPDLAEGQPVPGMSGTALDGGVFRWTPGSAPAVIVFLAHWCPACQAEVAEMADWLEQGNRLPEGVDFFGVSTLANPERDNYPPTEWLQDQGWPFPVLLDDAGSSVAAAFRLSGTPFWAIIEADGTLLLRDSGRIHPDDLVGLFNSLLAGDDG